ncbi:MAG: hypothetical protein U1E42_08725 [Rhodospirillales bacterium]
MSQGGRGDRGRLRSGARTLHRPTPDWLRGAGLVGTVFGALFSAALAGCAVSPAPCAVANDALAITDVSRDDEGFRVAIANRGTQPLTEKVFVEVAIVQAGRPVLAGTTAATASWPAAGTVTVAVPYSVTDPLAAGSYETFTHFKCLSE